MFLSDIGTMARKLYTKVTNLHKDCVNCIEVEKEFLSIRGYPILGECEHSETRFLLNEKTECKYYKMKRNV